MTKQMLENELKVKFFDYLEQAFANLTDENGVPMYDVLKVPLSEESTSTGYQLAIPTVDSENNEKTVLISIKVPRGHRDGTGYEPYDEHERYKANLLEQAEKQKEKEDKAAAKEKEKAKKQSSKSKLREQKIARLKEAKEQPTAEAIEEKAKEFIES